MDDPKLSTITLNQDKFIQCASFLGVHRETLLVFLCIVQT